MYESKKQYHYGTGRRKSSIARVRVYENGTGSIIINGREIDDYFGLDTLKLIVRQPLVTTDLLGKVDVVCTVQGGGVTGQAGAIRHGISRALLGLNAEYRAALKAAGFLTRDPTMKDARSTASKPPVALRSSPSADRDFKMPKNPGNSTVSGVFLFVLFWLNLTQPNRFYRGQLGDNSPFFVFMGQLRGQPREQLLGIWG